MSDDKWEEDEEDFEDDVNTVEENSLDNNTVIINYVYKIKEDENLKS
jgi:phosphoribosylformylglycinamidine (FGAM) synthase PurS component